MYIYTRVCIYIYIYYMYIYSVGPSNCVRCSLAKAKQHGAVSNGGYPLRAGGAQGQGLRFALRWRLSTSSGFSIAGPPGGIALRRRVNPGRQVAGPLVAGSASGGKTTPSAASMSTARRAARRRTLRKATRVR